MTPPHDSQSHQIAQRSGLASRDDLESEIWRTTFDKLESEQREFLRREGEFRSREYLAKWPSDALHWWSRQWEYPYVYGHLSEFILARSTSSSHGPTLVDLGSGVTFFPFAVARLGARVICVDSDPVVIADLDKSCQVIRTDHGEVKPLLSVGNKLEIESEGIDSLYSISVLEHVPDFENLVTEIHRVLKPGGLFILTIDIDLRGDSEMGYRKFAALQSLIKELFNYAAPDQTVHPLRVLDSKSGPFAMKRPTAVDSALFLAKRLISPGGIGESLRTGLTTPHLAVCGFLLKKK